MALPRRLIRQIREGTYRPSAIGKKAREAAQRIRQPPPPPPQPPREPGAVRPSFQSVKNRMKTKKHYTYRDVLGYNPRSSRQAVESSDARDEMEDALDWTEDQMDEFASRASYAWKQFDATGDAGELAEYLAYDFLWYH